MNDEEAEMKLGSDVELASVVIIKSNNLFEGTKCGLHFFFY